jgi:hypothetical protein
LSENFLTLYSDPALHPKRKIGYVTEGFCFLPVLFALWNTYHLMPVAFSSEPTNCSSVMNLTILVSVSVSGDRD